MIKKREVIAILGATGSGKSSLIKRKILPQLRGRIFILDRLGEYAHGVVSYSPAGFVRSLKDRNDSQVWTLQALDDKSATLVFRAAYLSGPCWLVLDEVDAYASSASIDPDLSRIIKYGRHKGVSVICAARRPTEIHSSIRAQASLLVSFEQREPRDIKTLTDRSEKFADVATLARYCYIRSGSSELDI